MLDWAKLWCDLADPLILRISEQPKQMERNNPHMHHLRRILVLMVALMTMGTPAFAQFGGPIVHDPLNEVHFLAQVRNQIQQINDAIANSRTYIGGWSNIRQRLLNLRQMVSQWNAQSNLSGTVADAQIQQLDNELKTIGQLQQLGDSAQGRMQAIQVQNRLQAELISQLHEQRQLTLSQIKQDQLEKQDAMRRFYGRPTNPTDF